MDKLEKIIQLQNELSAKVSASRDEFVAMSDEDKTKWVNNYLMAISNEMEELRRCFPFKWWKKHQTINLEEARKEWIDVFHFIINLGLVLGFKLDGSDIYEEYCSKNKVNHDRQSQGY